MFKRFFIFCSGADTAILKECSEGEQTKYAGIGATVFFTAVMAWIASTYALYTVFNNSYTSLFFGFIWGLLIFNLDRFIVSTLKKRRSFGQELLQAVPRIILAVIIAIVIAKPLEVKIFEKEINHVLLEEKNAMSLTNKNQIALQYQPAIEKLKSEIVGLKGDIVNKEKEVNALYETYISEAEGRKGTLLVGKGPVYKEKREKHETELAALQELRKNNALKIAEKENQIASLQKEYDKKVAGTQPTIDGFDGFMARVNAITKLPWLPSFFIFLLFLAIETAPIMVKLLSPRGVYDMKLEDAEDTIKVWVDQKLHQRKKASDADIVLNDKAYKDIAEEEELYEYKRKKAKALIQLQADAFYEQQKAKL
jgi:Domain of unknown function (DUF4407)